MVRLEEGRLVNIFLERLSDSTLEEDLEKKLKRDRKTLVIMSRGGSFKNGTTQPIKTIRLKL